MEKKLRFISCGKFDKKYWLIILIVIILLGASIGLFYLFKKYLAANDLKMKVACNCISIAFFDNFCKTLMFIPGLISKKMNSSNNTNNLTIKQREKNNKVVEYIFNQKTITFSKKEKIYLILLMILDLVSNLGDYYSQNYVDDNADDLLLLDYFFYTQIFFLFILSKYLLKNDFYKHQFISIIIITIINFINLINYDFIVNNKRIYFLFFDIFFAFLRTLKIVFIKVLMENKYMLPYKVTFLFGLFNFSVITVAYIIMSFIPCEKEYCKTIYNRKTYLANILEIFSITGVFLFLIFIIKAFLTTLNYIIILYFSVSHSFTYYQLTQLANYFIGLLNDHYENKEDINKSFYIYITFPSYVICIVFILIFLEVIEINMCGISYNTKENIRIRSDIEIEFINKEDDNSLVSEQL